MINLMIIVSKLQIQIVILGHLNFIISFLYKIVDHYHIVRLS